MRESAPPAPASTVKTKPSPCPKAAQTQNAEKSATSPPKHAQAINTAPSGDKNIPKSKKPDGWFFFFSSHLYWRGGLVFISLPYSTELGYSIFVKNLPYNATIEMVEQEFRKFGAIKPGGIQVRNRQVRQTCRFILCNLYG
jgi:hypothetical protein